MVGLQLSPSKSRGMTLISDLPKQAEQNRNQQRIRTDRGTAEPHKKRRWNRTLFLDFLEGYIACAIWTESKSANAHNQPVNSALYTRENISPKACADMHDECLDFATGNHSGLYELDPEQCGHDFWLTRNGHGAGFWDRELAVLGERLTAAAKPYGEARLFVGDNGQLHYSS
ncbi:hypothetical protein [Saccharopolyspora shandongensis]|uniref:hypothetical protein n=1 Tax=Saccharopolyspora shandongensis TaxID=418495 RepID=UPI0033D1B635